MKTKVAAYGGPVVLAFARIPILESSRKGGRKRPFFENHSFIQTGDEVCELFDCSKYY
ncbi:MAG: hypothetical protein K8F52_15640 [Candidatus Scalindua rubra]|nr:hypothetical protein [Candidatus Scalindua rubra]